MATKYWRGGAGTWDATTATNWSDTSGGAGGAIAPCALDDVIFNSASNATAYTVTIAAGAVCRSLNIAGPAAGNVTVAGTGAFGIFGSLTLAATGITRTYTGAITFRSTTIGNTITTNGISLASAIVFDGVGGAWTLGSAFTTSGNFTFNNGTFSTSNFALSFSSFVGATGTKTLNLGSSTVTASQISNISGLTLNAGTSTINITNLTPTLGGAAFSGATFYNVAFTNASPATSIAIYGSNTFNNLSFVTTTLAGSVAIFLTGNQTINGTLQISGSGAISRYFLRSDIYGVTRTITCNAISALTDIDFRDITVLGTSSPWSGTRLGNGLGNTNITFNAGVNKFWNLAAGGAWTAAAWATTSGGTASALNFPLPQDTVNIVDTGLNSGATISAFNSFAITTLSIGSRTLAFTLTGTNPEIQGNVVLCSAMTATGFSFNATGRTQQLITTATRTLAAIGVINIGNSVVFQDNVTTSGSISVFAGTLDTNGKTVSCNSLAAGGGYDLFTKTFTFGASSITCANFGGNVNLPVVINAGTSTITLTAANANLGYLGQTLTFNNVTFSTATTSPSIFATSSTFNNLTFTASTALGVNSIFLSGNVTVTGTLAFGGGTSVTQRLGVISDTIGTTRTISAATVTGLTNIDFRDINATGAANWTTGTRLGDCQGNTGITFQTKTVYWNLTGAQNWTATGWATTSGGTPAVNNFPLAQDQIVFDNTGAATTITVNALYNIGSIIAGTRTTAWTLAGTIGFNIYGSTVTYGSGITASITGTYNFLSNGTTQTFTTAGKTLNQVISIQKPSGIFNHGDAATFSGTNGVTLSTGNYTYNTQNFNITGVHSIASTFVGTINFGSSTITCAGSFNNSSTTCTLNAGTSTINLTAASTKTFTGGGKTFNIVSNNGGTNTTALTIVGSNTFTTLQNTANQDLTLTSGTTQTVTNFNYTGASGNVVDINTTTPGLQATLLKASGPWYAGANSTDGGNNSGWTFTAGGSTNFAYIKDIIAAVTSVAQNSNFFFFLR
jgi:hypothetical protein